MSTEPGMGYTLLLTADFQPEQLAAALSAATRMPAEAVDVAGQGSWDRSMDAEVYGTYEPIFGNIAWMVDISLSPKITDPPSWERLASVVAAGLGQPVLYEAQSWPDTAYWLASPEGWRTRARVDDIEIPDGWDGPAREIQAVERTVEAQPEVIRGVPVEAPITRAWEELVSAGERGRVSRVRGQLGVWEQLVTRMRTGWPPDGWYTAAYYVEDLEWRDVLETARAPVADVEFRAALSRVDDQFRAATREAGDGELAAAYGEPVAEGKGWWWRRLPDPVPWGQGREPGME